MQDTPGAGKDMGDEGNDAGAALFQLILKPTTQRLPELFPAMVRFLEQAEGELPHGCQPARVRDGHLAKGLPDKGEHINKNTAKHVLATLRTDHMHEKRGRVANLAGWQMASRRFLSKVAPSASKGTEVDGADKFKNDGCREPLFFKPLFNHAFSEAGGEPQVIVFDGAASLVMGIFAKTRGGGKKSRLATGTVPAAEARRLITAMPERSDGATLHFGPASPMRDIPLNSSAAVLELFAHAEPSGEGLQVALTHAAHFALADAAAVSVEAKIKKLNAKIHADAAAKLRENVIVSAPIKFVDTFAFNEHSFLAKPSTTVGMAMARSGVQHVAFRRAQLLGLDKETAALSNAVLQVAPIYFEREFWAKSKNNMHTYSGIAHRALADCVTEFTKKTEKRYTRLINSLRRIAQESISESFSAKS